MILPCFPKYNVSLRNFYFKFYLEIGYIDTITTTILLPLSVGLCSSYVGFTISTTSFIALGTSFP